MIVRDVLRGEEAREAVEGARVRVLELPAAGGYVVLHFDNGATLYADAPTVYAAPCAPSEEV